MQNLRERCKVFFLCPICPLFLPLILFLYCFFLSQISKKKSGKVGKVRYIEIYTPVISKGVKYFSFAPLFVSKVGRKWANGQGNERKICRIDANHQYIAHLQIRKSLLCPFLPKKVGRENTVHLLIFCPSIDNFQSNPKNVSFALA